jgi:hypothetical protein
MLNEGRPWQCPWMMDLGLGEKGVFDEFEGYQTNKANITIILRQS